MDEKTNKIGDATSGYLETYQTGCIHLLPCGICERTNKYCPIYHNWGNPTITWTTTTSCGKIGGKK